MSLPIFDFGLRISDRGFHVLGAMITEGFDRYGHRWRTFFEKITLFLIIYGKEIIIFVDKLVSF